VNVFLLLFKGFAVGVVFSATTVPATVWCVQLGLRRGLGPALTASVGVAVAQAMWATLAAVTVWTLAQQNPQYTAGARVLSSMVFCYMAVKMLRTPRLEELPPLDLLGVSGWRLALATMAVMLSMHMRFFGNVGFFLAAGVVRPALPAVGPGLLVFGVGMGTLLWFGLVGALAVRLRERAPAEWWVRAMGRLTRLAVMVYGALAIIVALPAVIRLLQR
jgi:putative LysE/RhtB family amino acid efflux pump